MKNVFTIGSREFIEILNTIPPKIKDGVQYIRNEQGNISFFNENRVQIYQKCIECWGIHPINHFDIHRKPDPPKLDLERSVLKGRIRTRCRSCNGNKTSTRKLGGSVIMKSKVEFREILKSFKTESFFKEFESHLFSIDLEKIPPKTNFFPRTILKLWRSDLKPHYITKLQKSDSVWVNRIMKIYTKKLNDQRVVKFLHSLNEIKEVRITPGSRGWMKEFRSTSLYYESNDLIKKYKDSVEVGNFKKSETIKDLKKKLNDLSDKEELNKILNHIPQKTRDIIKKVSPRKIKFYTIDNQLVIKKCPTCNEYKGVNDYTQTKNGYSSNCNRCKVIRTRKYLKTEIGTGRKGEVYRGRVIKKYDSVGNITHRRCNSCDEFKPVKQFIGRKGSSVCEDCFVQIPNNSLTRRGEFFRGEQVRIYDPKTNLVIKKRCCTCEEFKDLNHFYNSRGNKIDNKSPRCIPCSLEKNRTGLEKLKQKRGIE